MSSTNGPSSSAAEGNDPNFLLRAPHRRADLQLTSRSNLPIAVVEAVDPIVLDARIMDCCGKRDCDCELCEVPSFVNSCFDGELSSGDDRPPHLRHPGPVLHHPPGAGQPTAHPRLRLLHAQQGVRAGGSEEDPCAIFRQVQFPVEEFFPPNTVRMPENYEDTKSFCCCGS